MCGECLPTLEESALAFFSLFLSFSWAIPCTGNNEIIETKTMKVTRHLQIEKGFTSKLFFDQRDDPVKFVVTLEADNDVALTFIVTS